MCQNSKRVKMCEHVNFCCRRMSNVSLLLPKSYFRCDIWENEWVCPNLIHSVNQTQTGEEENWRFVKCLQAVVQSGGPDLMMADLATLAFCFSIAHFLPSLAGAQRKLSDKVCTFNQIILVWHFSRAGSPFDKYVVHCTWRNMGRQLVSSLYLHYSLSAPKSSD